MDRGTSTSSIAAELTQAIGYWTGANTVVRITNWSYDTGRVTAINNGARTHFEPAPMWYRSIPASGPSVNAW